MSIDRGAALPPSRTGSVLEKREPLPVAALDPARFAIYKTSLSCEHI
ncbi:MAG: hypothetical protein ACLPTZ_28280 [Beijerinckiaceae bacterium]